mmetsp:Transcript_8426/g.12841  ORF Transcript_8426/g.12841 Transcript_8426/m.12841 type:complete len:155 (+) Transcript_8426:2246-2710(+)
MAAKPVYKLPKVSPRTGQVSRLQTLDSKSSPGKNDSMKTTKRRNQRASSKTKQASKNISPEQWSDGEEAPSPGLLFLKKVDQPEVPASNLLEIRSGSLVIENKILRDGAVKKNPNYINHLRGQEKSPPKKPFFKIPIIDKAELAEKKKSAQRHF